MVLERLTQLREQYRRWKRSLLLTHDWVPIPLGFTNEHLRTVSPNALKVYLYFCLYADSKTGESRHSVKKLANYFGNTERAISVWIKELQQYGLIERLQMVANTEAHTFVLPLTALPGATGSGPGSVNESSTRYTVVEQQSTNDSPVPIALRLAQCRRQQGLTLAQLSQRTGLGTAYLSEWERGNKPNPSLSHIERLAKGLGVSMTYLLGLMEEQG